MAKDINVKGLKELSQTLQQFPVQMEKRVLRGAMRAGMKPIHEEAKGNAPRKSGELADGLKVRTSAKRGKVSAKLRAEGSHGFLAKFFEFGVVAHIIKGPVKLGDKVLKNVKHPGIDAHPCMRPALDSKSREAVKAAGLYIKNRISKLKR